MKYYSASNNYHLFQGIRVDQFPIVRHRYQSMESFYYEWLAIDDLRITSCRISRVP